MRFSKWHALGNVYLLCERDDGRPPLTRALARELCGDADGIVEVAAIRGTEADVIVWNRDGSTAELSGNGTRIAARWLAERAATDSVLIRVGERSVAARLLPSGDIETEVGDVEVARAETVDGVEVVPVSVGNPHAVVSGDPEDVAELGPRLTAHPRFPNGVNVEVARVVGPGEVEARVWERGVGETQSSGTGAVAVAAATHGEGAVAVRFPGGVQRVRLTDRRAWLTGPAERIAD
jgi:diaminopimelate epimerase